MIVFSAKLKAKYGKEKEVEDALMAMIPKVQNETGTIEYTIHRGQNNDELFFLYEMYKDKKSFDYHMSTTYLKHLQERFDEILEEEPQVDIFKTIASINP